MRALIVLYALVAMPLVAGVAQVRNKCVNGQSDLHRSAQGTASAHQGLCAPQDPPPPPVLDADHAGVPDNLETCPGTAVGTSVDASGCSVQSPPPTSGGCVNSGPAGGSASIDGQVFVDASPWPGLTGWCVELNGPVHATAATDAAGNYWFSGLPAGVSTVCEAEQADWPQTFPGKRSTCATSLARSNPLGERRANALL